MPTFDVDKVKSIASRYQGYGENYRPITEVSHSATPPGGGGFFQNVFNSVKNLGIGVGQTIFNAIKQSLWDEPIGLIKHFGEQYGRLNTARQDLMGGVQHLKDIQRRISQGQQVSLQEINAARDRVLGAQKTMQNAAWAANSTFLPGTKEYREKYLPVALTGASIASLGAATPLSAGVKAAEAGSKLGFLQKVANFGLRFGDDLFGFGSKFGKSLPMNIAGKLARNELLVKPTINDALALPGQIADRNYGGAAINAALLASGGLKNGPIGTVTNLLTAGSSKLGQAFASRAGVFDLIKIKNGSVYDALQRVAAKNPEQARQATETLKVYQDYLIRQWGDPKTAAKAFQEYVGNKDLSKMTLQTLTKELDKFRNSDEAIRNVAVKLAKAGQLTDEAGRKISVEQAKHIGAVRSPGREIKELTSLLATTSNQTQLNKAIAKFVEKNPRFIENAQNARMLRAIKESGQYGDDAVRQVSERFIKTKPVLAGGKLLEAPGGFVGGFRSGVTFNKADEVGDLVHGKDGVLAGIGRMLDRAGISPRSSSEGQARLISQKIRSSMDAILAERGINRSADEVINKLRNVADTKKGVFDIRQLRSSEVADALDMSKDEAKRVLGAYKKAVSGLSLEERGLAGKLTDLNLNYNPLAAPYSRIQNRFKYEQNPFFSLQERIETRLGTAALTGKTRMPGRDYTKQVKELEKAGFWSNAGFGSEGADIGGITNITSKLKRGQKETIAAGIEQLAQKQGKSITEFIRDPKNADLMQDFKAIVQYPDRGFTSSNLSKLLNLVAFPTRYNIKIAQFAVKQLAKQPGLVQAQVIRALGDYNDFMNSPEGIKFQADNKEVLGLLNYFTPLNNINQVMNILSGKARKPADFGLIGGLPFGVITQALQGQGLIQTDSPYVDPRTGQIYADKIPQSLRARAFQLLSDIIGTMYNYPGRQVGAPSGYSKKDLNEVIPKMFLGEPREDEYRRVTRTDVSPEDRKRMEVLNALPKSRGNPLAPLPGTGALKVNRLEKIGVVPGLKFTKPKGTKVKRPPRFATPIQQLR